MGQRLWVWRWREYETELIYSCYWPRTPYWAQFRISIQQKRIWRPSKCEGVLSIKRPMQQKVRTLKACKGGFPRTSSKWSKSLFNTGVYFVLGRRRKEFHSLWYEKSPQNNTWRRMSPTNLAKFYQYTKKIYSLNPLTPILDLCNVNFARSISSTRSHCGDRSVNTLARPLLEMFLQ